MIHKLGMLYVTRYKDPPSESPLSLARFITRYIHEHWGRIRTHIQEISMHRIPIDTSSAVHKQQTPQHMTRRRPGR